MSIVDFLKAAGQPGDFLHSLLGLFDYTPNTYFYIKDRNRQFLWVNEPLRQLLGANSVAECIGKTDRYFFSSDLVFSYHQEDDAVIASRRPLLNQPWIVPERKDRAKWFLSSKIPLFDAEGNVIALAGIMQNFAHDFKISLPFGEMYTVIDYIVEHYHQRINIETLASLAFLSVRQFERRFQGLFHMTPGEFILKVRIDAAVRHLIESDLSITKIAIQCGFYDNSHFTRQFKSKMGISPIQFRKKFS
jgi:AraC-like DNA-binding protein